MTSRCMNVFLCQLTNDDDSAYSTGPVDHKIKSKHQVPSDLKLKELYNI